MEFAKQFGEAAQKAVLSTIESGEWVKFPWMETLIKQAVREGLKGEVTIGTDYTPNPLSSLTESKPLDICGCPFGSCTCTDQMLGNDDSITKSTIALTSWQESPRQKDSFESNDFTHVEGYDWQVVCIDRMKNHTNSWAEHFNHLPTQEEFDFQFRHYEARTHYVHANRWENGKWVSFTADYVPHFSKEKPVENFTATEEWPEGKKWRIKFHDQRVGRLNYVYFDSKPGGMNLAKYHTAKCFAVVEARPANV